MDTFNSTVTPPWLNIGLASELISSSIPSEEMGQVTWSSATITDAIILTESEGLLLGDNVGLLLGLLVGGGATGTHLPSVHVHPEILRQFLAFLFALTVPHSGNLVFVGILAADGTIAGASPENVQRPSLQRHPVILTQFLAFLFASFDSQAVLDFTRSIKVTKKQIIRMVLKNFILRR